MDINKITIIADTREKKNITTLKAFDEKGIKYIRRKLEYCDYSFEYDGKSYEKKLAIEKKQNLSELSGNFTKGRDRFKREFERGMADGCKMVLLIEDKQAEKRIEKRIKLDAVGIDIKIKMATTWKSRFTGKSMYGSLKSFEERYDLDLIFCHKLATAGEILRVFEEYLKKCK